MRNCDSKIIELPSLKEHKAVKILTKVFFHSPMFKDIFNFNESNFISKIIYQGRLKLLMNFYINLYLVKGFVYVLESQKFSM